MDVQRFERLWGRDGDAQKVLGTTQILKRGLKKRKVALVLSGGELDTEGLSEDVKELFRYKDDGTVEVRKWMSDVRWNYFHGVANVCKDVELEKEDMPAWTRRVTARIWQDVLEDVEANNAFTKGIMWRSTDFLRHVVSEKEGRGAITFTYVCE